MNGNQIGSNTLNGSVAGPINFLNMTGGILQNAGNVSIGSVAGTALSGAVTLTPIIQTGGTVLVDTTSQNANSMTTTFNTGYTVAGGATLQLNDGGTGTVTLTTPTLTRSTTGSYAPFSGSFANTGFGGLATGTLAGTLDIIPVQGHLDATRNCSPSATAAAGAPLCCRKTGRLPICCNPGSSLARSAGNATADFTQFDGGTGVQSFSTYVTYAPTSGLQSTATATDVGIITCGPDRHQYHDRLRPSRFKAPSAAAAR